MKFHCEKPLRAMAKVTHPPFIGIAFFVASSVAVAQGQGSWGGATGLAQLVLIVIACIGLLLTFAWYLFFYIVTAALSKNRLVRPVLAFCIGTTTAFAIKQCHNKVESIKATAVANESLARQEKVAKDQENGKRELDSRYKAAISYMDDQCPLVRKVKGTKFSRRDGIALYRGGHFYDPSLLEIAPSGQRTDLPLQFRAKLPWIDPVLNDGSALAIVKAGIDYSEIDRFRVAKTNWWQKHGQGESSRAEAVMKSASDAPNDEYRAFEIETRLATYWLLLQDISTYNDRKHWVSRFRVALQEKKTEAVIAEYVSLIAYSPMSDYAVAYNSFNDPSSRITCTEVDEHYRTEGSV